jgi:hypothetical protein
MSDKKQTLSVPVTVDLPFTTISDLLVSALEGGSNYWCKTVDAVTPTTMDYVYDKEILYPRYQYPLNPGGRLDIRTFDDKKVFKVDLKAIKKGLKLLGEEHMDVMDRILKEDSDAGDADIFFQLCTFGKVIYG